MYLYKYVYFFEKTLENTFLISFRRSYPRSSILSIALRHHRFENFSPNFSHNPLKKNKNEFSFDSLSSESLFEGKSLVAFIHHPLSPGQLLVPDPSIRKSGGPREEDLGGQAFRPRPDRSGSSVARSRGDVGEN